MESCNSVVTAANSPNESHKAYRKFTPVAGQFNDARNLARYLVLDRGRAFLAEKPSCICCCYELTLTSSLHSLKSLQNASTRARSVSHENMIRAAPPMNV